MRCRGGTARNLHSGRGIVAPGGDAGRVRRLHSPARGRPAAAGQHRIGSDQPHRSTVASPADACDASPCAYGITIRAPGRPMSNPSQPLPTGTVTFLFTDIEGSTQLWDSHPEAMKAVLARHDAMLTAAVQSNHGHVVKSTGDGIYAVFETATQAVASTLAAQRALLAGPWDEIAPGTIRVRMGLHTGEAEQRDGDYFGSTLNRAARIMAAGHGGQVLLSAVTAELVRRQLFADVSLLDLGEHHLKGLLQPEHIFQILAPDLTREFPSLKSLSAARHNLPTQLTTFIGRQRELQETQEKLSVSRLLTLVGPGGTGKTRLAVQIGIDQLDHFKDGVWLVELAPIADPAFIESTIADVFEIREAQGVPLITLLSDYLRRSEEHTSEL